MPKMSRTRPTCELPNAKFGRCPLRLDCRVQHFTMSRLVILLFYFFNTVDVIHYTQLPLSLEHLLGTLVFNPRHSTLPTKDCFLSRHCMQLAMEFSFLCIVFFCLLVHVNGSQVEEKAKRSNVSVNS